MFEILKRNISGCGKPIKIQNAESSLRQTKEMWLKCSVLSIRPFNIVMQNVEKWPNIPLKSCGIKTARLLKYVWSFSTLCIKELTDRLPSSDCNNQQQGNQLKSGKLNFTRNASRTAK